MYLTLSVFLRTFGKIRSSGPIYQVARQRPRFYLRGPIRRGDGAYLTCKMRERMLTLNVCKKKSNDQESAKFAVDTKNDLKFIFHFSVWNWRLSKMNEGIFMHSAGHRKIINNIKRFVRILLKLPTKKSRESTHPKFQKKKSFLYEQFLIEWKIIFITLIDLP